MSIYNCLEVASGRIMPAFPSQILSPCTEIEKITGYGADISSQRGVYETFIQKSDAYKREIAICAAIWNNNTYDAEYLFRHNDGTLHRFIEKGTVCDNGEDVWIDIIIIDVSSIEHHLDSIEKERNPEYQSGDFSRPDMIIQSPMEMDHCGHQSLSRPFQREERTSNDSCQ